MWKFLILLFLFAGFSSCSKTPAPVVGCNPNFEYVYDHPPETQINAGIIKAVDEVSVLLQDSPVKWIDENFWSMVSGLVLLFYEYLALKLPTSKSVSIIGNFYKLLTWFFPDKSKNGGIFTIGNKF